MSRMTKNPRAIDFSLFSGIKRKRASQLLVPYFVFFLAFPYTIVFYQIFLISCIACLMVTLRESWFEKYLVQNQELKAFLYRQLVGWKKLTGHICCSRPHIKLLGLFQGKILGLLVCVSGLTNVVLLSDFGTSSAECFQNKSNGGPS